MNVHLGETFDKFVADLIASGEYQSQSEVVRDGLRLLKDREELRRIRQQELRRELQKGIDELERGEGTLLATEKEIRDFFEDIKRRGRQRLAQRKKESK